MRILGGEVWDGFEFCSPFGGAVEVVGPLTGDRRRLVVTCEEGVRRYGFDSFFPFILS